MLSLSRLTGGVKIGTMARSISQGSTALNSLLEPDNRANRAKVRQTLADPLYHPRYDVGLAEERSLALARLQDVASKQLISVFDFEQNPKNIFAVHEIVGMVEASLATKMTVQFNLFGGTLIKLGTDRHRKYLPGVDNLENIGCFALTELGYGNNAVEMETTAKYTKDADGSEHWVINSPSTLSQKYWITNSALHAKWAVVFAQLLIGGQNEGVHAFMVPIRDAKMNVCPGVTIQDMGKKMECNGVDNGRLWFDHVKVPIDALLNRYSDVSNGKFESKIEKKRNRFLKVADQLLSGRICIASMCLGGTKTCLTIALNYGQTRLTVGKSGKSDKPIISYRLQQNALMPLIAQTYALNFALVEVKEKFANLKENDVEMLILCCVIKPMITWGMERAASVCRERCGGQGYLACNKFGAIVGLSHAGITAEGDNCVLMQKVSKELLQFGIVPKVIERAKQTAVKDPKYQRLAELFQTRLARNAEQLTERMMAGATDLFETWVGETDLVQDLALSYGEFVCFEAFLKQLNAANDVTKPLLQPAFELFCLETVAKHSGYYLQAGLITPQEMSDMQKRHTTAVTGVYGVWKDLIGGFNVGDELLVTPIAADWVDYNKSDNRGEVIKSKI